MIQIQPLSKYQQMIIEGLLAVENHRMSKTKFRHLGAAFNHCCKSLVKMNLIEEMDGDIMLTELALTLRPKPQTENVEVNTNIEDNVEESNTESTEETSQSDAESTSAEPEPEPASASAPLAHQPALRSKKDIIIGMMSADTGASIAEIKTATQWQEHTIRAWFSICLRKQLGLVIEKIKGDQGETRFKIKKI